MINFNINRQNQEENIYLPHNFLAEKIILNSLLVNAQSIEMIIQNLTVDSFYFKNHQEIYKAILTIYNRNQIPDFLLLNTFLKENGLLEQIGGRSVLTELTNPIPRLTNIEDYIQLLQDKFFRRTLIKLGYQVINSAYITNLPLENILQDLELKIFNLTNDTKYSEILTTAELFHTIFAELKQKSITETSPGLLSGFKDLDFMTQGFQKSDLIIIAGRPSMGKTAFSLQIALQIVKSTKLPTIFFSLEMSREQLTYRLLATETKITNQKLKTANLSKQNWEQVIQSIKEFSYLPFFIDDTPGLSILDIRSKIRKILFEQDQIGMIVIDYLQLMQNSIVKTDNRVQELSEITRSLKNVAREFKIPVLALSQLSRSVESRVNKRPILSDLRESGSIEQDADLVMMLYRDDYYNSTNTDSVNNDTEVIITKHRNGPTGTVLLSFDRQFTKFASIDTI